MIKFSEHKMPSQAMKRNVNNFYHFLLKITEPAYDGHISEQICAIQRELSILGTVCDSLSKGFSKLADGAESSFAIESDDRWKRTKKEIEADFGRALELLKGFYETKLFKVEEFVEELNAEIQQFSGELLKVEHL